MEDHDHSGNCCQHSPLFSEDDSVCRLARLASYRLFVRSVSDLIPELKSSEAEVREVERQIVSGAREAVVKECWPPANAEPY